MSEATWRDSAMRAYRSRLRRAIAERFTVVRGSSLLPTMRTGRNSYGVRRGTVYPALLPTLVAKSYGSNQGGAAGRVGPVRRPLLPTLMASRKGNARKGQKAEGGPPLLDALGAEPRAGLNRAWTLSFMGFPEDWLNVNG